MSSSNKICFLKRENDEDKIFFFIFFNINNFLVEKSLYEVLSHVADNVVFIQYNMFFTQCMNVLLLWSVKEILFSCRRENSISDIQFTYWIEIITENNKKFYSRRRDAVVMLVSCVSLVILTQLHYISGFSCVQSFFFLISLTSPHYKRPGCGFSFMSPHHGPSLVPKSKL